MTAYLDNAATTRPRPEVLEILAHHSKTAFGNPSSIHGPGRQARRVIEDARERIADRFNVSPLGVIFTSGATEANNLALLGLAPKRLVISSIEHESVLQAARRLGKQGADLRQLPVDGAGRVSIESLHQALPADLVSIMAVNNEVGTIQDTAAICSLAHDRGALVHVDAVQALGKMRIDFPADLISISSHKIHGPKGVGALISRHPERLSPILHGGSQEFEKRAGTENVAGIAAFAKAFELAQPSDRIEGLRDRLESGLLSKIPGSRVNGDVRCRAPHLSNLQFDGIDGEALVMALDARGIWVSTGSACAALGTEPSHVLAAMGLSPAAVRGSIRFSLAHDTTESEIDEALSVIPGVVSTLRGA